MRRIFESWWWVALGIVGVIICAATFPSDPVVERGNPVLAYTAAAVGIAILLMSLGSSASRLRHRGE